MKFSFNTRKLKYGSASVVFIVLVIAVVVVLNILASFLTERFSLKVDMTEAGLYSLSEDTRSLLSEMEDDVKIYILSSRAEMENDEETTQVLETVRRYSSASHGHIEVEFIDPNKNPQFFKKYPKAKNARLGDLVVEGPERYIVLDASEFKGYGANKNKVYYQSEEKISGAVLYVTNDKIVSAGFVTGHDETVPDALLSHFEGNNFDVTKSVDLLYEVSPEISNLVIAAPRADFTETEIENLEKYLAKQGNALYVFWGIETPKLERLERYLAEWGFEFPSAVVCDEENAYMNPANVVADLLETPIIDKNLQGQAYIIAPQMRPIKLLYEQNGYNYVMELVRTRDTSYSKVVSADLSINTYSYTSGDVKGPFTAVAVGQRMASDGSPDSSKVIVFGAYGMAFEQITAVPRAFNATLLARLVDYANPNTKTITLSPKVDVSYDLDITESEVKVWSVILIGIIPALFIALAIFIFIRRKNR